MMIIEELDQIKSSLFTVRRSSKISNDRHQTMWHKTFPVTIKWLVGVLILFKICKDGKCAEITHAPKDVEVTEEGGASFICTIKLDEFEGNPDLAWERDGTFIALGNTVYHEKKRYSVNVTIEEDALYKYKTSILKIRKARPEDAGTLMCYLHSNDHVSVATTAELVVLESIPRPRCSKVPMEVIVGENVTISCTAKQLSYTIELHWWSRGTEDEALRVVEADQKVVGRKFTLNHTFTVQSSDEGRIFKCRATFLREKSDFVSCTTRIVKTLSSILSVSVQQQNPSIPGDVACFECYVNENLKNTEIEYTWTSQLVNPLPKSHDSIRCFGNVSMDSAGVVVNCTAYHGDRRGSGFSRLLITTVRYLSTTISTRTTATKSTNHIFGSNSTLLYVVIVAGLFILMVGLITVLVCCIQSRRSGVDKEGNCTETDIKTFEGETFCGDSYSTENTNNQHDCTNEQHSDHVNFVVEGSSADIAVPTGPCKVRTLNFNLRASTAEQKGMVKHTVSFSGYQCGDDIQYACVQKPQKSTNFENSRGITRGHTQHVKPRSAMKPLSKALSLDQRRLKTNLVEMRAFNDSTRNAQTDQTSEPPKQTKAPREKETIYLNVNNHLNSADMNTGQQNPRLGSPIRLEAEARTKSATLSCPTVAKTLNIEGLQYADLDFKSCGNSLTQPEETTQYAEIKR